LKEVGGTSGLLQGNPGQLLIQAEGVGIVILFNTVLSVILYKLVDVTIGLRVTLEEEVEGLDISLHGETVH
jgi:Amt family ammonium transporter